jgi:hypothetical protein
VTASIGVVLGTSLLYALAFVSIYGREHPWLIASRWIYENAKPGSVLAIEAWDDSLPVLINSGPAARRGSEYRSIVLPIYDQDGPAKLGDIASALAHADFVIVASRRAYGSIGQSAERFPLTSGYYQKLFAGELGFELAETVRNDPQLGAWQIADDPRFGLALNLPETHAQPAGQTWNWGFADESLTVYDHPQPLIFRKARALSQAELYALLSK